MRRVAEKDTQTDSVECARNLLCSALPRRSAVAGTPSERKKGERDTQRDRGEERGAERDIHTQRERERERERERQRERERDRER